MDPCNKDPTIQGTRLGSPTPIWVSVEHDVKVSRLCPERCGDKCDKAPNSRLCLKNVESTIAGTTWTLQLLPVKVCDYNV